MLKFTFSKFCTLKEICKNFKKNGYVLYFSFFLHPFRIHFGFFALGLMQFYQLQVDIGCAEMSGKATCCDVHQNILRQEADTKPLCLNFKVWTVAYLIWIFESSCWFKKPSPQITAFNINSLYLSRK